MNERRAKIEALLRELHEEVMDGVLQGEIDEDLSSVLVIPHSKKFKPGVVVCRFSLAPEPDPTAPSLRVLSVIEGGKQELRNVSDGY